EPIEKVRVGNDAVLNDLSQSGTEFTRGQTFQQLQIATDEPRLVKSADEVFSSFQVHAHFATDRTVYLGEQRRRDLDESDAAQVSCGHEAGQIAYHSAAQGHDHRFAIETHFGEFVVAGLHHL